MRGELGVGDETFVVGWAGRLTAIKRPLDLVRTLRALVDGGRRRAARARRATARTGQRRRRSRGELGVAGPLPLRRLPAGHPGLVRRVRRARCSPRRTRARRSSRSRRWPPSARSSRPTRAARRPSSPTARAASSRGRRHRRARRAARGARATTPSCARRSAGTARDDVRARFATGRMADELDALYRTAAGAVKVLHVHKITRRQRLRAPPARAAAGAASGGHRRALPRPRRARAPTRRASTSARRAGRARTARVRCGVGRQPAAWRATSSAPCGRERPDLLHTHLVHADVYGSVAARRSRVPVRLDAPQRRPLPARAVPLRRPRASRRPRAG